MKIIPLIFFALLLANLGCGCLFYCVMGLIELSRNSRKHTGTDEDKE